MCAANFCSLHPDTYLFDTRSWHFTVINTSPTHSAILFHAAFVFGTHYHSLESFNFPLLEGPQRFPPVPPSATPPRSATPPPPPYPPLESWPLPLSPQRRSLRRPQLSLAQFVWRTLQSPQPASPKASVAPTFTPYVSPAVGRSPSSPPSPPLT